MVWQVNGFLHLCTESAAKHRVITVVGSFGIATLVVMVGKEPH